VDGAHIRTLILTLLYRYFRPLIDNGYVYIAQPPLYKVKKGKEIMYFYSEEAKVKALGKDIKEAEVGEEVAELLEAADTETTVNTEADGRAPKVTIQRYKGLGEMNAEELWETTMDPARRVLKQINIEDAQEADKIFDMLMGVDVPARKSFIQSNAKLATLDI
jgi:DNA gyrase subunit B